MKYIQLEVRTAMIVHGYDSEKNEIVEKFSEQEFTEKLVLIDRIQSISDQYILVKSSHGRVMYWEYNGSFDEIKKKLRNAGLVIG